MYHGGYQCQLIRKSLCSFSIFRFKMFHLFSTAEICEIIKYIIRFLEFHAAADVSSVHFLFHTSSCEKSRHLIHRLGFFTDRRFQEEAGVDGRGREAALPNPDREGLGRHCRHG